MLHFPLADFDLNHMGEAGLVIFFVVFVAVTIWAFVRPKAEVNHWESLPLGEDADYLDEGRR